MERQMNRFPGQQLITLLEEIRLSLKPSGPIPLQALKYRLENSGLERTYGLMKIAGDDCSYYRKSLDIFLKRDYNEVYKILAAVVFSGAHRGEMEKQILKAKELMEAIGTEG